MAGNRPMIVSMISPMLFWPSLVPCAKDTPVQVAISSRRIHHTGGLPSGGGANRFSSCSSRLPTWNKPSDKAKPSSGENSSPFSTSTIACHSTPWPRCRLRNELASAMPTSEPISAWDDEFGMPKNHVTTFQPSAVTKRATNMPSTVPPFGGERTSGGRISTRA